jgi:branched-chain amino acid transport system permease protein
VIDFDTGLALLQDGVVNGAVYGLLALALVLVFAVTRVIFIPVGELVSFAALAYAGLDNATTPPALILLAGLGVAAFLRSVWSSHDRIALALETLLLPAIICAIAWKLAPLNLHVAIKAVISIAIIAPMAPLLYRIAFRPLATASVLVLLMAAVGMHLALTGLGLLIFGPEGARGTAFSDEMFEIGKLFISGQSLFVLGFAALAMAGLWAFFRFTLSGAALRATAISRRGAMLVGIAPEQSGVRAFWLAGVIASASGVLIAPLTTIYYDGGFLIGLKGFVAAIIGGLASYPIAAAAAIIVGVMESFSAFWASSFKEVIVFAVIIPVLLWRSLNQSAGGEEE